MLLGEDMHYNKVWAKMVESVLSEVLWTEILFGFTKK